MTSTTYSTLQVVQALKRAPFLAEAAHSLNMTMGRLRRYCTEAGLENEYQDAVKKSQARTAAHARAIRARNAISSGKSLPKKQVRSSPLKRPEQDDEESFDVPERNILAKQPRTVKRLADAVASAIGVVSPTYPKNFEPKDESDELMSNFEKNLHKVTNTMPSTQTSEALLLRLLAITDILIGEYKKATTVAV